MTLPLGGEISLANVNVELGLASTTTIDMNQASVRTLFEVPSGAISMSNGYGKSNRVALSQTFALTTSNQTVNISSLAGYQAGKSDLTITVNAGVYVYSTSTATPALSITGGTAGDTVTIVNNGFIMGMGGNGGAMVSGTNLGNGTAGGTAISLGFSVTINNQNGYIGGGGGGGGSGGDGNQGTTGGGGAGGGNGGSMTYGTVLAGGAGGAPGLSGGNGNTYGAGGNYISGGGGGRVMPGTGGAARSIASGVQNQLTGFGGGSGGGGSACSRLDKSWWMSGSGGGGGYGASGGNAVRRETTATSISSGAGGSANAAGANGTSGGAVINAGTGGAGGKAINLNGNTVTWVGGAASSSRAYGAVS